MDIQLERKQRSFLDPYCMLWRCLRKLHRVADAFPADTALNEALRKASKRRAIYAGAPSLGCLAQYLNELLDQDPFLAFYPVFVCGTTWYIHIDDGEGCVLLDNELLYEDYELTQ